MSTDEVVVTAVRTKAVDGSYTVATSISTSTSGNVYTGGGHTATSTNTSTVHSASVNIEISNPANLAEAQDAAQNIAKAITLVEDLLDSAPPTAEIRWDGRTYTPQQLKDTLNNTQFIVDDQTAYGNGGVGSAQAGANGSPNIDHLNAHAFASSNAQGYAAPTYNGQGVAAMVLHELGHLTTAGVNEDWSDHHWYQFDYGTSQGFNGSLYWHNEENFAHDFETAAASAVGLDVRLYETAVTANHDYGTWQDAYDIYTSHHPEARIVFDGPTI